MPGKRIKGHSAARCRQRLAALLLCGAVSAAAAQDAADTAPPPRYAVEFILFEYSDDVSAGGELFPPDEPAFDELAEFADRDTPDRGETPAVPEFSDRTLREEEPADLELEELVLSADIELTVLGAEQRTLQSEYETLRRLDAYRPVLWSGWMQSSHERDVTPAIPLRRLGNAPLDFDGTLQLYLSRFLHLVVDLRLEAARGTAPAEPRYGDARRDDYSDFAGRGVARTYHRITEDRIVKSGDLRYFDHPKFGLLAKVTRVEEDSVPAAPIGGPLPAGPAQ